MNCVKLGLQVNSLQKKGQLKPAIAGLAGLFFFTTSLNGQASVAN